MDKQSSSQGPSHDEDDQKPALGFIVVRPNERRRQQILNQAQSEERAYEEYKQSRPRLEHICEAPRRLCGIDDDVPSIAEARMRQQHQLATAKIRASDKARRLREKAKEEEEEKWRLRKEEAAKKAERNREKKRDGRNASKPSARMDWIVSTAFLKRQSNQLCAGVRTRQPAAFLR